MSKLGICFEADNNTLSFIIARCVQMVKNKALSLVNNTFISENTFLLIVLYGASNTETNAVKALKAGCSNTPPITFKCNTAFFYGYAT